MNNTVPKSAETSIRIWLALLAASAASAGSVWLSLGLELKACPLCLYQRACIFCTAAVLAIGVVSRKQEASAIGAIALAPAAAALGIGLYHVYLERTGALECPPGIANIGTAPQQAVAAEAIVALLMLIAAMPRWFAGFTAIALGAAMAMFMIRTAPPPVIPIVPYEGKFDVCRPPYVPGGG